MKEQNESSFPLLLITGNSWSWKSYLGDELIRQWWKEWLSFTTRTPRNDDELDRYVFLTDEMFEQFKEQWRFMEYVEYKGNKYALSAHIPNSPCFVIVEPNWREQILNFNLESHKVKTVFIQTDEEERKRRLLKRDWHLDRIDDSFAPTEQCIIINGADSLETNIEKILA